MNKYLVLLIFCGQMLFCGGCFFSNYRRVNDFDLDMESVSGYGTVHVGVVRNASSSGLRIQSRSYFELMRDPYNVWAKEPGALVCNALNRALGKDGVTPKVIINCDLEYFEADIEHRVFRISGVYSIRSSSEKIRFDITAPLRSRSPESIVIAASEAVRKLAVRMSECGKKSQ